MESNIEIILMGSIDRLMEILDYSMVHNCINIYKDINDLLVISHDYDELMYFMKGSNEFTDREYVLKELTEDRLKLQAMMSLGFSFEDSLYEIYIKDKEPILHSYI